MAEDTVFASIFGYGGMGLAQFFFISPIVLFIELQKTKNVDKIPGLMLLFNTLNTAFWMVYGFAGAGRTVYICNSIGLCFSMIWVVWYLLYKFENFGLKVLTVLGFLGSMAALLAVGIIALDDKDFASKVYDPFGWLALVVNILMYAAPGQNIVSF